MKCFAREGTKMARDYTYLLPAIKAYTRKSKNLLCHADNFVSAAVVYAGKSKKRPIIAKRSVIGNEG